jgi:peptidoglycan hydrolase-like protein with peptidoglycan-binding domain
MNITKDQLTKEVGVARKNGWLPILTKAEKRHNLPAGLLLAIASRETDMQDIVGDGGHGRGLFQIDDRSHSDFLAQQGAAGPGGKPPIASASDYAAGLLASNLGYGQGNGVPAAQLLKFACSAYNAGPGNAVAGFRQGDSDKRTAGGNYGADVLDRLAAIQAANGGSPATTLLQQGSRGPKVTKLKTDLQAWYDRNAPGIYAGFKITPGGAFGPALVACVSDFQRRNGLAVTGAVDQAFLTKLAGPPAPPPGPPPPQMLERGMKSPAVASFKRDLKTWFDRASSGEWQRLGVAAGPVFGASLEQAVREFQQRNGLSVDGQAGQQTLGALAAATPAPGPAPAPTLPELLFDSPKKRGSSGDRVKLIQEWLNLHGFNLAITGKFDPATDAQVRRFQRSQALPATGVVDVQTYAALVQPMVSALMPLAGGRPLGELVVAYARQHLAQGPHEVGGDNCGPWVRLYTGGQQGSWVYWCAAFATFVLDQAAKTAGKPAPISETLLCDHMQGEAGARFLPSPTPSQRSRITPGSFFLRRATSGKLKYEHTGIVVRADANSINTIEGNTNDDHSSNGVKVCAHVLNYPGLDFIVM